MRVSPPPEGPFRTKSTLMIEKIVNYYAVAFLLRPPDFVRRRPFFERKIVCNSQGNGVRTRCAAIANHNAIVNSLRVVNLLRVVFLVRPGPLGMTELHKFWRGRPPPEGFFNAILQEREGAPEQAP